MARQILKCSSSGVCVGLGRVLDDARIRSHIVYNLPTCEPVKWMVAIHAGEHKKNGIVMNFCPFCGQKLGLMKYTEKKKQRNAACARRSA